MSLWFRRKQGKRTDYYLVPFSPLVIVTLVGLFIGLLLPLIHWLRAFFE